jgi:hypothetical protein
MNSGPRPSNFSSSDLAGMMKSPGGALNQSMNFNQINSIIDEEKLK